MSEHSRPDLRDDGRLAASHGRPRFVLIAMQLAMACPSRFMIEP